ncbi:MAG TPA: chromate efflux transporter [Trueperaceae bacterium]
MQPEELEHPAGVRQRDGELAEVARLFTKLGFIAFGGPAAHIALMHDEAVVRRKWLSEEEFLDLLGATNLIPGPNSTEMTMHLGLRRAGWRGLVVGGACFILPAMAIVLAFAWAYVRYGDLPQVQWLLYGVTPVIIAVVFQALWGLGRKAVKNLPLLLLGSLVLILYLLGAGEIPLLFGAGLVYMLFRNLGRSGIAAIPPLPLILLAQNAQLPAMARPSGLATLFLLFLKIGSVLYGSGYVLLAFLQNDFVDRLGWLTNAQLIDAVAVGQFTPGPVFTTATFIGYVTGGWGGAVLATLGIFLPGFVFVALVNPVVPRLRESTWFGALLDGVNVAALALMAAVTLELAGAAVVDLFTAFLALTAAVLLLRYRVNSVWLVLGGGLAGLLFRILQA